MFNIIVTVQALSKSTHARVHARIASCVVIPYECVSGDGLCESLPFVISIQNCNVQHHSNHTGSVAIYSREISRERSRQRSRVTLLYNMSANQRLIAINFRYYNLLNRSKYRVAVYKKNCWNYPINTLTTTTSYISRDQHFSLSIWYFFFIC